MPGSPLTSSTITAMRRTPQPMTATANARRVATSASRAGPACAMAPGRPVGSGGSASQRRYTRPAMSRTIELFAGILLLGVGILILGGEWIRGVLADLGVSPELWSWWPVLLVGLSLFFLAPAVFGEQHRRLRAGMVIPGAVLAAMGSALLYTSLTNRWEA